MPFLLVAIVLGVATICAAAVRLTEQLPINPWEPAIAMEAMRLNAGLPLYDGGHATHIYGPLLTITLAAIFRVVGLNLLAARVVMSIFGLGLAIFLSTILCRGNVSKYWWLAFLLFLGINFRTNLIFLSAQPDCVAALLAVVGLYFWITQKNWIVAVALFICAMLFKQTFAAFALIPVAHLLMWKRPLRFRAFAISIIPTMSILVALAVIRFLWPRMFAAIVTVPASIIVYPERALGLAIYLLGTFPLFLIALLSILRSRTALDQRERWILSALVVLIPVSIWTICKSGGSYNSLLPAYLAMTALFVVRLEAITDWLRSLPIARGVSAASAIALIILLSFFIQFDRAAALLFARAGDDKYDRAVSLARQLDGAVITTQDPTIAYRAKGYFGRSLFFELDAHAVNGNWPSELPVSILQEFAQANYVIVVRSYVPTPVFESSLPAVGFHQLSIPELSNSAYTLWSKNSD